MPLATALSDDVRHLTHVPPIVDVGRLVRRSRLLWIALGLLSLLAIALFAASGFTLDAPDLPAKAASYLAVAIVAQAALQRRVAPRLAYAMVSLMQLTGLAGAAMLLTYSAAAAGMPLFGGMLLMIDHAIGYDWAAYAAFVARNPHAAGVLRRGYQLIFALPIVVIFPLAFQHRFRAIDRYLLATAIALIVGIAIFALCPALTAWDRLGVSTGPLVRSSHLPTAASGWVRDLLAIRAGQGFDIRTTAGSGLIAFPSFHCVAGVLAVWALWPVRVMRPIIVPVAVVLIASAPVVGGHFLTDLIAGAAVAWGAALLAERIERHIPA
jgi:hypothetical protein